MGEYTWFNEQISEGEIIIIVRAVLYTTHLLIWLALVALRDAHLTGD